MLKSLINSAKRLAYFVSMKLKMYRDWRRQKKAISEYLHILRYLKRLSSNNIFYATFRLNYPENELLLSKLYTISVIFDPSNKKGTLYEVFLNN